MPAARRRSCSPHPNPKPCADPSTATLVGQAKKEFFVNQALCLLDALHMHGIKASQTTPPATAAEAECYRVKAPATGAWVGREDRVAVMIAGEWHFIEPVTGMTLYDRSSDNVLVFRSGWKAAQATALPNSGAAINVEVSAAIGALVQSLKNMGVLASTAP